jgi:hypothetical protein
MQNRAQVRPVLKEDFLNRIRQSGDANRVGFVPDPEHAADMHVADD